MLFDIQTTTTFGNNETKTWKKHQILGSLEGDRTTDSLEHIVTQ